MSMFNVHATCLSAMFSTKVPCSSLIIWMSKLSLCAAFENLVYTTKCKKKTFKITFSLQKLDVNELSGWVSISLSKRISHASKEYEKQSTTWGSQKCVVSFVFCFNNGKKAKKKWKFINCPNISEFTLCNIQYLHGELHTEFHRRLIIYVLYEQNTFVDTWPPYGLLPKVLPQSLWHTIVCCSIYWNQIVEPKNVPTWQCSFALWTQWAPWTQISKVCVEELHNLHKTLNWTPMTWTFVMDWNADCTPGKSWQPQKI